MTVKLLLKDTSLLHNYHILEHSLLGISKDKTKDQYWLTGPK